MTLVISFLSVPPNVDIFYQPSWNPGDNFLRSEGFDWGSFEVGRIFLEISGDWLPCTLKFHSEVGERINCEIYHKSHDKLYQ